MIEITLTFGLLPAKIPGMQICIPYHHYQIIAFASKAMNDISLTNALYIVDDSRQQENTVCM